MLGGCPKYVKRGGTLAEKEGCNHATGATLEDIIDELSDIVWDVV